MIATQRFESTEQQLKVLPYQRTFDSAGVSVHFGAYWTGVSGVVQNCAAELVGLLMQDISEFDLTTISMKMSEPSFSELWDQEDNDYWNSYLK